MNLQVGLLLSVLLFWSKTNNCAHKSPVLSASTNQDTLPIPCNQEELPHYSASHINGSIRVDGHLDEQAWKEVKKSPSFRDLIHGTDTRCETRAAVLWDDDYLYVGYWIEEPNLQASLTERDAPIYRDNDVELFIAGQDAYYEFEINTFGTIYEVFFIWEEAYEKSGYAAMPEFDRNRDKVRPFLGVGYKSHPRGPRIGFWNWDFPGLQSAVQYQGTLNDSTDVDQGWTVELALPWQGMSALAKADQRSLPPLPGDIWRMDFSRFNQQKAPTPANDSGGWAWSPHGVWDSHVPECFTVVHFEKK